MGRSEGTREGREEGGRWLVAGFSSPVRLAGTSIVVNLE